ncbi:glycosyltransferase family A protein [Aureimonas sp. SA4125]|uniref:glycosyltransferase family 2 protein n=1 Tax=Aureimonas sp. SA4125 TaxID=2826993 RepID=UPI00226B3721|nr:glycosyltransferase family A protein [Aureimonas sp. SA4125]
MMLSVVLPNFNHAQFLPFALDALLAQQRPADEIIIVDDASTDESLEILGRYAQNSRGRIRILSNCTNLGALGALQRGLDAALGRYVYFAAADDYVLPGFFTLALSRLEEHPSAGLFCGDAILLDGEDGRVLGHRPAVRPLRQGGAMGPGDVADRLRTADNFILTGSAIIRRDAIVSRGGFDLRAGSFADGVLARKIALGEGMVYEPRPMAAWNVFREGYSRTTALDPAMAEQALHDLPQLLSEDPEIPAWYPAFFQRRWRFAAARVAIEESSDPGDLLRQLVGASAIDRVVIAAYCCAPRMPPAQWLMLAWLQLRLRPYRLVDLVLTALERRQQRKHKPFVRQDKPTEPGKSGS